MKRRQSRKQAAKRIYDGLMGAALHPRYFEAGDIADTFEARAQMVSLHMALIVARLTVSEDADAPKLSDDVNALILDGFDAAFREEGVGDSSIARKVRKLAEEHSGLGSAMATALASNNEAEILDVLQRNGVLTSNRPSELPRYFLQQYQQFTRQTEDDVLAGHLNWQLEK